MKKYLWNIYDHVYNGNSSHFDCMNVSYELYFKETDTGNTTLAEQHKPGKDIPAKPDTDPDPTKPKPGGNEPEKNDPTRIEQPSKIDPTRIDEPPPAEPTPPRKNESRLKPKK